MANVGIATSATNRLNGTVLTGGTITPAFQLSGHSLVGLIFDGTMVAGTLTFQVSDMLSGTYYDLKDDGGSNIAVGPVSGSFAVSSVTLAPLVAYDYVKIKFSSAQTNGGNVILITKA